VKACGLVGSPVRGGNVDLLVGQAVAGASSRGATVSTIYLNDLSIRPCQSCGPNASPAFCRFEDDMRQVFDALEESDIVVLGSPVYFDSVSAQTKLMIDRCNCLTAWVKEGDGSPRFEKRLKKRKTGVLVAVAGSGQDFRPIQATAAGFFKWINAHSIQSVLYSHDSDEKGGVRIESEWMQKAFDAGVQAATLHAASRRR
jgi:multimeric flavodoxin WrbA